MSRIALVHDYFVQMGGAERVAETFSQMFPRAPVYTTVAVRDRLTPGLRQADMHTSWMQHLPALERNNRRYFMLYPLAVESLNLSEYDLIISSSSGYAKGVRKRRDAIHICYCHTPMRWVWRYDSYAERESFKFLSRTVLPTMIAGLRHWDQRAAQQPDYYLANSHVVAERIKQIYHREAIVIPPAIDVDRFKPVDETEDYFLVLSRLVPYKQIDLAVEACTRLGRKLIVIGAGPDRQRLEAMAGPTVQFLGRQSDAVVEHYASRCRALLFTGEEDFGITPLEINAAGRPVIAYRAGGATETVREGITGLFFDQPTAQSLTEAIEEFDAHVWDQSILRRHAEGYDHAVFENRFRQFLHEVAPSFCATAPTLPKPIPSTTLSMTTS